MKPNIKFEQNGDEWKFSTITTLKTHSFEFKLNEKFEEVTWDDRKLFVSNDLNKTLMYQILLNRNI